MSESERNERRRVVAMVGNPTSDKGRGAKVDAQVLGLLEEAGRAHNFDVIDITGVSFDDSLNQARERAHEYDYLVVVGGDGMIALGANAVGCSGKPLGIVATGSGNDFARGLKLPVNRIETAVKVSSVLSCAVTHRCGHGTRDLFGRRLCRGSLHWRGVRVPGEQVRRASD